MPTSVTDSTRGAPRWMIAQRYERSFWHRLNTQIHDGRRDQLDWYKWRADQLQSRLAGLDPDLRVDRALEIGSGPIGLINFLSAGERFAVDPLEHFYRTQPALVALRSPGVTYVDGPGERLPFEDGSFSLVVLDNVIDHTRDPRQVLSEARRVLAANGRLYLAVNVHTAWGARLHDLMAKLLLDPGHPFTYTSHALRKTLADADFSAVQERIESFEEASRADRGSGSLKARVKGYTGMSEFAHSVICRRNDVITGHAH